MTATVGQNATIKGEIMLDFTVLKNVDEELYLSVKDEFERQQNNIELIEKDRLLTELEKDFRLLAKELTKNDAEG